MSAGWWPPFLPATVGHVDPADEEPTDAQLGGYVTDPFDSPSYTTLTSPKGSTK